MSKSIFTIIRQCEHCKNLFEAQKRTTRFCSHKCNASNYKLRKRLEAKQEVEAPFITAPIVQPKIKSLNLHTIKDKEFLSVKEVALLFGCSKQTIYRMISNSQLKALNVCAKLTRIQRKDIDALFNMAKSPVKNELKIEDCYTMGQIVEKYKVSRNTIYNYGTKHQLRKLKSNGITYYSQTDIDNLFIIH